MCIRDRRSDAIESAEQLTLLGLLSESQCDHYRSSWYAQGTIERFHGDEFVNEFLGITDKQIELFENVAKRWRKEAEQLNLMTTDPAAGKERKAIKRRYRTETLSIYTAEQNNAWERLTAKRSPPAIPDWRALDDTTRCAEDLTVCSTVFRSIERDLNLSKEQQRMLDRFEPIVQQGLDWIKQYRTQGPFPTGSHRNDTNDPIGQVRNLFLEHAECIAKNGFLTPQQIAIVNQ